jgi:hypothetical protein
MQLQIKGPLQPIKPYDIYPKQPITSPIPKALQPELPPINYLNIPLDIRIQSDIPTNNNPQDIDVIDP